MHAECIKQLPKPPYSLDLGLIIFALSKAKKIYYLVDNIGCEVCYVVPQHYTNP